MVGYHGLKLVLVGTIKEVIERHQNCPQELKRIDVFSQYILVYVEGSFEVSWYRLQLTFDITREAIFSG